MTTLRERRLASNREWRIKNPGASKVTARQSNYMNKFGIGIRDFDELLRKQGGVCAICRSAETVKGSGGEIRKLSVDHCHATGVIRGLLCYNCNHLLGKAKDNTNTLRAAAIYLENANTGFKAAILPDAKALLDEIADL